MPKVFDYNPQASSSQREARQSLSSLLAGLNIERIIQAGPYDENTPVIPDDRDVIMIQLRRRRLLPPDKRFLPEDVKRKRDAAYANIRNWKKRALAEIEAAAAAAGVPVPKLEPAPDPTQEN